MLKQGTILCDRYKIVGEVGSGGMSNVYKAQDLKLNRFVAIKVLKPEFSRDKNFVTKFRIEAQASAGLSHPNIVNVYDVVEEDGMYFIVMEFVDGITLKEYIEQNGRLNMDKALDISVQIASGLEAAHEHHIIHRDIKPQNIIVSRNGNIKVTDFGIAKAATSNTLTSGAMGSVHYISPEQARGGYSDERSDIYSLGITMYEMVTGRVPFEGDNNVSVALMHIQNDIIPPRQYYPEDIYSSLEKIILKATQKKPERRYLTASALIADLKRVQNNPNIDIKSATTPSMNANTQEWTKEDVEAIRKESANKDAYTAATRGAVNPYQQADPYASSQLDTFVNPPVQNEMGEIRAVGSQSTPQADNSRINKLFEEDAWEEQLAREEYEEREREEARRREAAERRRGNLKKIQDYEEESYEEEEEDEETGGIDPNLKMAVTIGAVAAAVIIAIILFVVVGNVLGLFKGGKKKDTGITTAEAQMVEMPDVVGYAEDAALSTLKKAGFTDVKVEHVKNEDVQEGYVFEQSIPKNQKVIPTETVTLKVSAGAEEIEIPDVTGYEDGQAVTILTEAGFKPVHGYEFSETVEKDKVIRTEPGAKTMAAKGSEVKVIVSNGSEKKEVTVPPLSGQTEATARNQLTDLKLQTGNVTHQHDDKIPQGSVVSQSIPAGTKVTEGTTIDIVVSDGPEPKETKYTANIAGTITCNDEALNGQAVEVQVLFNGEVVYQTTTPALTNGGQYQVTANVPGLTSQSGSADFRMMLNGSDVTGSFSKGDVSISYTTEQ